MVYVKSQYKKSIQPGCPNDRVNWFDFSKVDPTTLSTAEYWICEHDALLYSTSGIHQSPMLTNLKKILRNLEAHPLHFYIVFKL